MFGYQFSFESFVDELELHDYLPLVCMCARVSRMCYETAVRFNGLESFSLIAKKLQTNLLWINQHFVIVFFLIVIPCSQWIIKRINIGTRIRRWPITQWDLCTIWSTTVSDWANWEETANSTASQRQVSIANTWWFPICLWWITLYTWKQSVDKFRDKTQNFHYTKNKMCARKTNIVLMNNTPSVNKYQSYLHVPLGVKKWEYSSCAFVR